MKASITCTPTVFNVPTCTQDPSLVALMMPFETRFDQVSKAIKNAANQLSLKCQRVDDLFQNSVLIQDVFELIFKASIIVCDCSGKNPNVLYETGIAHVLGRNVILITQNLDDIPFDLRHHRIIKYLSNTQGLRALKTNLKDRIQFLLSSGERPIDTQTIPVELEAVEAQRLLDEAKHDIARKEELEILRMKCALNKIDTTTPASHANRSASADMALNAEMRESLNAMMTNLGKIKIPNFG